MRQNPRRVGIAGATGYAGQELVRHLARHPGACVSVAMASAAADEARPLPALARIWDGLVRPLDVDALGDAEAVFLALPEAAAAEIAPRLVDRGVRVFDLSGAFRLRNDGLRQKWYPATAGLAGKRIAYGLPEHEREAVRQAQLVACPGCYPTAALLALKPLADGGLLTEDDIVIDAKSGISGAGKAPSARTHFSENHGSAAAYGVFAHRHGPEIEQELGRAVTFVPHLVPLDRGILVTLYARLRNGTTASDVAQVLEACYADAPFVRLFGESLPEIKQVAHTNFCDLGWRIDGASSRIVLVACIDNLVKGAAGQAIQNFNIAFGFDERAGLL